MLALWVIASWAFNRQPWPIIGAGERDVMAFVASLVGGASVAGLVWLSMIPMVRIAKASGDNTPLRGYAPELTAAVAEELAYRGLFLHWAVFNLRDPVLGVFTVNAAFGLAHLHKGFPHAMSTAFLGVIASVMTIESHSLLPALALHLGGNAIVVGVRRRIARKQAEPPAPVKREPDAGGEAFSLV